MADSSHIGPMKRVFFQLAGLLAFIACLAMDFRPPTSAQSLRAIGSTRVLPKTLQRALDPDGDFDRIPVPRPGDWLAVHPEAGSELENWIRVRLLEILRDKAGYVAGGMRRSATRRSLLCAQRKPVDTCANYLLTHAPYLKYNHYLSQGYPIATGVIEGACRHLVKDRMEVTGARWSLTGAEAVLRLRALRSSHDFDQYWSFHEEQEYERNHSSLYAHGIVPPTFEPRKAQETHNEIT